MEARRYVDKILTKRTFCYSVRRFLRRFSSKCWKITNSDGTRKSKASVPTMLPPTTPVPRLRLPFAPTPIAATIGSIPKISVRTVIIIGRRRAPAALIAASCRLFPALRRSVAYSVTF